MPGAQGPLIHVAAAQPNPLSRPPVIQRPAAAPILRLSRLSRLSMSRRARRPGRGPTQPRFAPAAAPRALRAPWTEVVPGAGRLRAARERGKPQTQLRWVSRVQRGVLKGDQGGGQVASLGFPCPVRTRKRRISRVRKRPRQFLVGG